MKHNLSKTRLYSIYYGMKQRCYNPNNQHYKWYGGKGITICNEWLDDNGLQRFIEWSLNNGYEENLSIDRVNPNGNYAPDNCRWVTPSVNSLLAHSKMYSGNKGSDTMPISMGEKIKIVLKRRNMTTTELAEKIGTSRQNLTNKFKRNNFSEKEIAEIAAVLDCTFEGNLILKDTGEVI